MSRERSSNRKKALKMWLDSGRTLKLKDIALELGVSDVMIRKWKWTDQWDEIPDKRNRGGQKGNQNAKGNKGGSGGPLGNDKAVTHGFFRKFLPQDPEYLEILDMVQEMDPLDMMYQNIELQQAAIIRAQRIMFVQNKDEMIKELKKQKFEVHSTGKGDKKKLHQVVTEEEHEFQFSWDRYSTFLKAQSVAMSEFRSAVKQFLSAAPENDERRVKLQIMQAQVEKARIEIESLKGNEKDTKADDWISGIQEVANRRREAMKGNE
ncbi:hypothetical protein BVG16_13455 [Paenibacillus selenitireducens]|uniref:PBSX phage terminase small subunit-like N-terminal domain-containing protein n=1 Tax=Paenibacillus selenitireducens TaxID=1324314 RepID=A0A1T2XCA3_9BACL|nr:phage terminase small subunit [Paenibacillus selenitireducens]OPA77458.1 hypothetical protein BVG16_13455 [Paenibacillus selenitireducens]